MIAKTTKSKTSNILTMADLLASQKENPKRFSLGEKIEGTVLEILPNALVLDIGGKSEGLVAEKAFNESKNFIKQLQVGDKVIGKVIVSENPEGYTILSLREANKDYFWAKLEKLEKGEGTLTVVARAVNPSGVIVDVYGLGGFVPTSQLGKKITKNLAKLPGESLTVKIIELNRNADRIVLSEKAVSEKESVQNQADAIKAVAEGEIYIGKVTTVVDFGIFVEIKVSHKGQEVPLEGLVHISELAWEKVDKTKNRFEVGDQVKVKVIEKKDGKLSLSVKQAAKDPWEDIQQKYTKDMKVKGRVTKRSDFGVFVSLEPGVEGLIHMTKIPPGMKLREGDEVEVYIEEVSNQEKRIALGLVLTEKPVGYK